MANHSYVFDSPTYLSKVLYSKAPYPPYESTSTLGSKWAHVSGQVQSFNGVSNPNWRVQIFRHQDATTPYTATQWDVAAKATASAEVKYWAPSWNPKTQYNVNTMIGDRAPEFLTGIDSSDLANLDNLARTKFYRQMQAAFNGGTFIGELRETVSMIRNPARALKKGITDFKVDLARKRVALVRNARKSRTPRQLASDYRKIAADTWLEYRFGWTPLMMDIEGLYQTALDMLQDPTETQPFYVEQPAVRKIPRTYVGSDTLSTGPLEYKYYRTTIVESSVAYGGATFVQINSGMPVLESLGFLPEQFVPTAWELLPYSWVADYFTNIGDVLNAYATAVRLRYVYCYCTRRVKQTQWIDVVPGRISGYDPGIREEWHDNTPGFLGVVGKSVSRSKQAGVPLPSFDFSEKLSVGRDLNLLAVVSNRAEATRFRNRWRV